MIEDESRRRGTPTPRTESRHRKRPPPGGAFETAVVLHMGVRLEFYRVGKDIKTIGAPLERSLSRVPREGVVHP